MWNILLNLTYFITLSILLYLSNVIYSFKNINYEQPKYSLKNYIRISIIPVIADLSFEFFCQLMSIDEDVEDKISTIGDVGGAIEIKKTLKIQCIHDFQKPWLL